MGTCGRKLENPHSREAYFLDFCTCGSSHHSQRLHKNPGIEKLGCCLHISTTQKKKMFLQSFFSQNRMMRSLEHHGCRNRVCHFQGNCPQMLLPPKEELREKLEGGKKSICSNLVASFSTCGVTLSAIAHKGSLEVEASRLVEEFKSAWLYGYL